MIVSARIPGTAGELAQGYVDGNYFLVTNPIDLYSEVTVTISPGEGRINIYPQWCLKARKAVELTLNFLGICSTNVEVRIKSQIPVGKGMASSTADIVAVIEATAKAFGTVLSPEQVSSITIAIEPSDGLMYRGIIGYDYRAGKLLDNFGFIPMTQLVIDLGGSVDTVEFNRIPKIYTPAEIRAFGEILTMLREGIKSGNLALVGQAATRSSQINQRFLFKPELGAVIKIATECGAFGVACAHSGTVLSLIFSPQNMDGRAAAENQITQIFDQCFKIMTARSVQSW
jgi:L-threonine kinase